MGVILPKYLLFLLIIHINAEDYCPDKCTCKKLSEVSNFIKLKCGLKGNPINTFEELELLNIASEIAYL